MFRSSCISLILYLMCCAHINLIMYRVFFYLPQVWILCCHVTISPQGYHPLNSQCMRTCIILMTHFAKLGKRIFLIGKEDLRRFLLIYFNKPALSKILIKKVPSKCSRNLYLYFGLLCAVF